MKAKYNQNISKKDLSNSIKFKMGTSLLLIEKVTDDIIDIVSRTLSSKKKIKIKNFGSFNIIQKKKRIGRNPKTKEIHYISSRNSISFKASNYVKKKINEI